MVRQRDRNFPVEQVGKRQLTISREFCGLREHPAAPFSPLVPDCATKGKGL